jgi:hypothetical protein
LQNRKKEKCLFRRTVLKTMVWRRSRLSRENSEEPERLKFGQEGGLSECKKLIQIQTPHKN